MSPKWSLPFSYPTKIGVDLFPHAYFMSLPSNYSWFYHSGNIWWRV